MVSVAEYAFSMLMCLFLLRKPRAVKMAFDIQVDGKHGPVRPKMTWRQLTERDRREWKLSIIDPHNRDNLEIWCEICHACSKPATWKGAH